MQGMWAGANQRAACTNWSSKCASWSIKDILPMHCIHDGGDCADSTQETSQRMP